MSAQFPLVDALFRSLPFEGQLGTPAEINEGLLGLLRDARTAWPNFEVDDVSFVEHLGQRLQPESPLKAVHAADLFLAFACLLGDPAALAAFDQTVLQRVPTVLRGPLPTGMTSDDILQALRMKLFVREDDGPVGIAGYSGRGALIHWLRAAAVRLTQNFARRKQREVATPDEALINTKAAGNDPEFNYMRGRYSADFKVAFQEALSSLSARDQNLVRLHYLDGMSPEEMGRIYQTHRTTVWRWLAACREELLAKTRELLAARVNVSESEFSSLMNAVQSQLDVSLNRVLRDPKVR